MIIVLSELYICKVYSNVTNVLLLSTTLFSTDLKHILTATINQYNYGMLLFLFLIHNMHYIHTALIEPWHSSTGEMDIITTLAFNQQWQ